MRRAIVWFIVIVLIGGSSGVFFQRFVVPWLAVRPPFSHIQGFAQNGVTVVNPKEEFIIDRAAGTEKSVAIARNAVFLVERRDAKGNVLAEASGVALTADGILATDAAFVKGAGSFTAQRESGETFPATLLSEDPASTIALIRIEASGLPVLPFGEQADTVLGTPIFALSATIGAQEKRLVLQFFASFITQEATGNYPFAITKGMPESFSGAPLFTSEAKLIGMWTTHGVADATALRTLLEKNTS